MKSIPEDIYLSKDLFHEILWSTECLTLHPEFPSGGVEGQQLQQHRVQSLQRQMANALCKHQFVVDTMKARIKRFYAPDSRKEVHAFVTMPQCKECSVQTRRHC